MLLNIVNVIIYTCIKIWHNKIKLILERLMLNVYVKKKKRKT